MATVTESGFYPWLDGFCHTVHHADRAEWMAHRKTGIGGSGATQLFTGDLWKLWDELTGGEPENLDGVEYIQWGTKLEGLVIAELGIRTGRDVVRWNQTDSLVSDLRPWQRCTPDAFQIDPERGPGLVSAKCTREYLAADWEDGPPLKHQVQLQHEMAVTGMDWGSICVLIGGNRFAWFDCERNNKFIAALIQKEQEFWQAVQDRTPPPVDASDGCAAALKRLYPKDLGDTIGLPGESVEWAERMEDAKGKKKSAEDEIELYKNMFAAAFGEASFGVTPTGDRFSYKQQTRGAYVAKESTFRVLRKVKA